MQQNSTTGSTAGCSPSNNHTSPTEAKGQKVETHYMSRVLPLQLSLLHSEAWSMRLFFLFMGAKKKEQLQCGFVEGKSSFF